jgi:hypothetical protein
LDVLSICFFTLGLIKGLSEIRKWEFQALFFYIILGILLGGVFTINSPMPSRYVIILPAVAAFIGYGVFTVLQLFKKKKTLQTLASIFIFIIIIFAGLHGYFYHESILAFKHDTNTQIATYAGRYLREIKEDYKIYFLGDDNMYYKAIPTLPFLTRKEGKDLSSSDLRNADFTGKSFFIILPSREVDLSYLKEKYRGSSYREFRNPQSDLLFYLFEK